MNKVKVTCAGAFWAAGEILVSTPDSPYILRACNESRAVITLGIGSESGFDISYHLSHVIGTNMAQDICQAQLSGPEPITTAFLTAAAYLTSEFPSEAPDANIASCTILCVLIQDDEATIGWLGNEEAYLIRNHQITQRTHGHIISQQQLELLPPEGRQRWARWPTRYLSSDKTTPVQVPESLGSPWHLLPGDKIVLITGRLLEELRVEAIPDLIQGKTVLDAAQALVQETLNRAYSWGAAAVVIEIG